MNGPRQYLVNEVYLTIQGEGVRYGIPHVFIRLAKCNLTCGFCDTEFESYTKMTAAELVFAATAKADTNYVRPEHDNVEDGRHKYPPLDVGPCRNVLFCGGEPLLQLDDELVAAFKAQGWFIALETNGSKPCPDGVDWVVCSPKVAEHAIDLKYADEVKYVRAEGQGIPHPKLQGAKAYLISPMYDADFLPPKTLAWCIALVENNPAWRLTIQHHKAHFGNLR